MHGRSMPAGVLPFIKHVFHMPVALRSVKLDNWAFLMRRAFSWVFADPQCFLDGRFDGEAALPLSFPFISIHCIAY